MSVINKLYHSLAGLGIVRKAGNVYRNGFILSNIQADKRMAELSKRRGRAGEKIRVGFLCQYIQSWNKSQAVFERMIEDERFEPVILAVPEDILKKDDKIYEYFHHVYRDYTMDTRTKDGFMDLEKLKLDYIFYQRPYDQYLPTMYQSKEVSKYAKICHIAYGFALSDDKDLHSIVMNRLFFRNVYLFFAENKMVAEYNINRMKSSHKKGYRKTVDIGYPILEEFVNYSGKKEEETNTNNNQFRIIWSPRWSDAKEVGGSNFLTYYKKMMGFVKKHENFFYIFRPHPMTFGYFVSNNKISQKEIDAYQAEIEKHPRMTYSNEGEYAKRFFESDVLVTDFSSIVVEYFITGKPIIYCETGVKPNAFLKEIMKVSYVTTNWEETEKWMIQLSKGIDPKKEERARAIKELFGDNLTDIPGRFLKEIYKDHMLMNK